MLCMQSAARIICEPAARMYTKVGMFPRKLLKAWGNKHLLLIRQRNPGETVPLRKGMSDAV